MKDKQHRSGGSAGASERLAEAWKMFGRGEVAQSESILRGLLARNPQEKQAMFALGIVASETGRRDAGVAWILRALEVDPDYSLALCCMSVFHLQAGEPLRAAECAERAVTVDPDNPDTHAALARCYSKLDRKGEAADSFQRAMALNPRDPQLMIELADSMLALRRERDAVDLLRLAVTLAPDPRALVNLAYLELRVGRIEDAEMYCRRALKQNPRIAQAHLLLARILTEQLRFEEAETQWTQAESFGLGPAFTLVEKALSLGAIGRFDEAVLALRRSIEFAPREGAAYQALAYAKRILPEDLPLVRQMESLLAEGGLPDADRLSLLYSLGKSYDNLGDYERAIGYFDAANKLKRDSFGAGPFDRAAFTAGIDAKIRGFTGEFFSMRSQGGSISQLPIFIVGMMRSGTTLAEQMLTCHPSIGGAGEQEFWGLRDVTDIGSIGPERLREWSDVYEGLLKSISPGFPHVIDKNPANLNALGMIHLAFPNARIVHTLRNAVDTALSIWMTPMSTTAGFVSDRDDIVFAYKECMRLAEHWREVLPIDRYLEVRYEEVVSDPETQARRMIEFCGLPWDEACLHPELNRRRVKTPSLWQVRQPIYSSSTDRWKRYEPWLGAFEELRGLA